MRIPLPSVAPDGCLCAWFGQPVFNPDVFGPQGTEYVCDGNPACPVHFGPLVNAVARAWGTP